MRRNEYGDTTGLTSGEIAVLGSDENFKILTYQRGANKHPVIVVASFNGHRVSDYALPLPEGEWKIRFNSSWKGYSTDFAELKADTITSGQPVDLPPYTVLILTQAVQ